MSELRDYIGRLKRATDAGAVLVFDGEVWAAPVWFIGKRIITVRSGRATVRLYEPQDDDDKVLADLRQRLRAMVDADV